MICNLAIGCRRNVSTFVVAIVFFVGWWMIADAIEGRVDELIVVQNASIRFRDRVQLSLERPGIVSKVWVQEGDIVEQNEILASLEDSVPRKALAIAEADANSDVEVRLAEKKFESNDLEYHAVVAANIIKKNAYTESEVQRLKLAAESSKIEIDLQKHKLGLARLRRDQALAEVATFQLRAPFSGVITKVQKNMGEAINQQDPLLELVGVLHVCVDGYVDLASAKRVAAGDVAEVSLEESLVGHRGKKVIRGRLRFVDVSLQRVRGVVRVIADFENSGETLRDGLNASMSIIPRAVVETNDTANSSKKVPN